MPEKEPPKDEPKKDERTLTHRYLDEFRQGFLYEVLRWGNDRLLHGGSFMRLVERACAEFAREGHTGSDAASTIFEEIFRSEKLDHLLGWLTGEQVITVDPARVLVAFEEALERSMAADRHFFTRWRVSRLTVEFLRTLERVLGEDGYLTERFRFEYGLFLESLGDGREGRRLTE
ncbi:MAG: hypothetical protein NTW26_11330 [bacterium]|nr:hypothetical protein [bacterium]